MKYNILAPAAFLAVAIGLSVASCHDDDGNYSYVDLDEVEIESGLANSGDEDILTFDRGDRLHIDPTVYFNGKKVENENDAPLSYVWTFYTVNTGIGVDYTVDTLATTRVLDADINRKGGTYYAQLTVTNTNTGIETYYRARCNVEESITAGWLLAYERADMPGYTDAGLVVNPLNKKNVQKNKEFWNLYSSSNGNTPLPGTPVSVFHQTMPLPTTGTPRIATTKTIAVVSPTDFSALYSMNELFYDAPQIGEIQFYGPCARMNLFSEGLIMDNSLLTANNSSFGATVAYFGLPKTTTSVDPGELAPWACSRCIGAIETVVYSQTKGAFYYTTTSSLDYYSFGAQLPVAKFDVNNTQGAKMLFADWNTGMAPTACYDYFLFAQGDNRYIAEANFAVSPALPNLGMTWADVSSAPKIKEATTFAVNSLGRYAYYGAGKELYCVAYDNGRATVAWTAPDANEVVTCVRTHKYYYTMIHQAMMPNAGSVVHIATWNEAKKEGKLYEYRINPGSGQLLTDGESYEYTVPGKVKDMCWKYEMAN